MPISIYPPTLKSTQPAFLSNTSVYPIYFALQSITSFDDIGHIQVRIVRQTNNKSIVDTNQYPDGTIYKEPSQIGRDKFEYYISISSSELSDKWQPGCLYKIQMRFGINPKYTNLSNFATWKQQQIDQNAFSEWSTVMIVKAISEPTVYIKNAESIKEDVISTENTEVILTPLFSGAYEISTISKEAVDKYKFDLYKGDEINFQNLLESSSWLQHNGIVDGIDTYRFKTVLTNEQKYTVVYSIITINGYKQESAPYNFVASQTYLSELKGISLSIESNSAYCKENGCIRLYCSANTELSGNFIITRTSEKSNYSVWEDLSYLLYSKQPLDNTLIYQDFTIESGIKYKYAIQQENAAGLRTSPVYEENNYYHYVNFEYSYLYRNGVQLKLAFNQSLSSFKHTTLRTKQDTLGDKYPHLLQNGQAYYAEFPISGVISFQMDKDQTFFTLGLDGYYYNGELVIPRDKFISSNEKRGICKEDGHPDIENSGEDNLLISSDLTDDNIFIERIFREKAEEFLNDFEYKLYKSPTEGNIIIGLMNISLTPNATLGRMIFTFSATAYEVLDNTIENLNKIGIIDIGGFASLSSDEISLSFGQINNLYGSNVDVYSLIRQQEEVSIGEGYKTQLKRVTSIWVEQYPYIDFKAKLLELQALRADALNKGESTVEIDREIKIYNDLRVVLSGPLSTTTILNINGTRVLIAPNKVYQLKEGIISLNLVSAVCPIIINYVCELNQVEDTSVGVVSAIESSRIWGQISGIFTGTDSVLKTYNYNYKNSETYRIYNNQSDGTVKYDAQGNILVDNTTFNVYKTINILNIIKQETQRQVEGIYNTKFDIIEGQITDGTIYYQFNNITLFDIEADEGTTILIGKLADGSDSIEVKIGPTGRYVISPVNAMLSYIALKEPRFCVINYKCLTSQMKMSTIGG